MVRLRRPPKMMALTGTPSGSFAAGSSAGLFAIGAVNRLLGWAALRPVVLPIVGVHGWPVQSMHSAGRLLGLAFPPDVAVGRSATLV